WLRVEALPIIAPHLPTTMHDELLALAKSGFEQPLARVETLATLATIFKRSQRDTIVKEALRETALIDSADARRESLVRLATAASPVLRKSIVADIRAELDLVQWNERTARVLADLSSELSAAEFEDSVMLGLRNTPADEQHRV